jgi:hypothetical protein
MAEDHDAMFPSLYEVVIEQNFPLLVHQLAIAMGHEWFTWFPSRSLLGSEIHEAIRELLGGLDQRWHEV